MAKFHPQAVPTLLPLLLLSTLFATALADDSTSTTNLEFGPGTCAAIAIASGIAVCFFGHYLLRPTIFACGFLVGGFVVSSAVAYIVDGKSYEDNTYYISFIIGGLFLGILVLSIYNTGIFLIGAAGGIFLAIIANTSFGYELFPDNPSTGLIILVIVFGLVGGILAFKLEKPVIVLATSLVGAALAVQGIGYFGGDFPDFRDLKQYRTSGEEEWIYNIPSTWWAYLAGIVALFVLGVLIQFKKTSLLGLGRRDDNYHA